MARPARNYANIQFEELRRQIDGPFNELHDGLEEAYYGDRRPDGSLDKSTGWMAGVSKPWEGFDKEATPTASKALFNRLHGALWQFRALHFHAENLKRPQPYPADRYDEYDDEQPDGTVAKRRRVEDERASLRDFRQVHGTDYGKLRTALQSTGINVNPDATD